MSGAPINVAIKVLAHGEGLAPPARQSAGAAGYDLRAAVFEETVLAPGAFIALPTGLALGLPFGVEAQVRPRSGLAARHGVSVLNSPGTVDADYRGEVMVILINHGPAPFRIARGDRIAQMVIARVAETTLDFVTELEESARGTAGLGSTGASGGV